MIMAIWILFAIGFVFWILCAVACALGHCQIGLGEEYWENKIWEKIYYNWLAPISVGCFLACVVLVFVCAAMNP